MISSEDGTIELHKTTRKVSVVVSGCIHGSMYVFLDLHHNCHIHILCMYIHVGLEENTDGFSTLPWIRSGTSTVCQFSN